MVRPLEKIWSLEQIYQMAKKSTQIDLSYDLSASSCDCFGRTTLRLTLVVCNYSFNGTFISQFKNVV